MAEKKVVKTFVGQIKSIDEINYVVEAVASDETIDRYGEIVLAEAYRKSLKDFKKHAVLLAGHDYYNITSQIGEWEKLRVEGNQLVGKAKYYVGLGNPQADWAWELARKGIAAFSVGFIPKEWEDTPYDEYEKAKGKKPWRTYKEVELLEISHVSIPANPSALQRGITSEDIVEQFIAKSISDNEELSAIVSKSVDSIYEVMLHTYNNAKPFIREIDPVLEDLTSKGVKDLDIEEPVDSNIDPTIENKTEEEMDKILEAMQKMIEDNKNLTEQIAQLSAEFSSMEGKMLEFIEKIETSADNKIEPTIDPVVDKDAEYISQLISEVEEITKKKAKLFSA